MAEARVQYSVKGPVPRLAPAPSPASASARSATAPQNRAEEDVADEPDELLQPPIPPEPALPVPVPRPPMPSSSHWAMTGGERSFQDTNLLRRGVNGSSDGFPAGRLSLDSEISFGAPRQYQSPYAGRESRATKMKVFTDETLTTTFEVDAMLSNTIVSRSCVADWFVALGPGSRFIDGPYGHEQVATIHVQLDRGLIFPLESLPVVAKYPPNVALWISLQDIGKMTIQDHHFPPENTACPPVPVMSEAMPHSSHPEYGLSLIEEGTFLANLTLLSAMMSKQKQRLNGYGRGGSSGRSFQGKCCQVSGSSCRMLTEHSLVR